MLNRSPTKSVPTLTPEEAWSGKKAQVSHLKVFGSIAYVWSLVEKHSKLYSKCKKLIFTGYSDHHKAYRLISIEADKCNFSRDVVLDENASLFLSTSNQKSSLNFLQRADILLPNQPFCIDLPVMR